VLIGDLAVALAPVAVAVLVVGLVAWRVERRRQR
jgi:hypothetical protein